MDVEGGYDDAAAICDGDGVDSARPEVSAITSRELARRPGDCWSAVFGYFPDEREEQGDRDAAQSAYVVLRVLLPVAAVLYWCGWKLIPEGRLRVGWTNGPVVLIWISLLVLAMPQLLLLWTEPDVSEELRAVASAVEKKAYRHAARPRTSKMDGVPARCVDRDERVCSSAGG